MAVAASAATTSGMNERTGDGSTSEDADRERDLHDLPGRPLPHDRSHGAADILHIAPVGDAAMHVPGDAARERHIEEQTPVVGRDGGAHRQAHTEAAGNDLPPPGAARCAHEEEGGRGQERTTVEPTDAAEEGTAAEAPDHREERGRSDGRTNPPQSAPHGSTNRSA